MNIREQTRVLDDMFDCGLNAGGTIYKLCPQFIRQEKCDENCLFWVLNDSSFCKTSANEVFLESEVKFKIIPIAFKSYVDSNLLNLWNVGYFPSFESAKKALDEYYALRLIDGKDERKAAYDDWVLKRRQKYLKESELSQ